MRRAQISFQVTEPEKNLLEEVAYLEPWVSDAIDHRRRKGNQYQVKLDEEEVQDCLGALLYEANGGVKRHKNKDLIALFDKISRYADHLKDMRFPNRG